MKTFVLALACLVVVSCTSPDSPADKPNLPWVVSVTPNGETRVFGVIPGALTLREFAKHFQQLADVRLFQKPDGSAFLEAYLGKTRMGKFDARLVAELDAPDELLQSILITAKDRKPTPNNYWQYNLNDQQLLAALELRVWRFMYIPIADYEEKQIGFFGKPEVIEEATEFAEYRFFPEKGLVVLWNKEGKETFYYVSPKDFDRLKSALKNDRKPENKLL